MVMRNRDHFSVSDQILFFYHFIAFANIIRAAAKYSSAYVTSYGQRLSIKRIC
jgi:hypothetical protein